MRKGFRNEPPSSLILHHKVHNIDDADFFHLFSHGSAQSYFYVFLKSLFGLSCFPFSPTGLLRSDSSVLLDLYHMKLNHTTTESTLNYSKISHCRLILVFLTLFEGALFTADNAKSPTQNFGYQLRFRA